MLLQVKQQVSNKKNNSVQYIGCKVIIQAKYRSEVKQIATFFEVVLQPAAS